MKQCMRYLSILLTAVLASTTVDGQIVIDGTKDAGYGAALAVQSVQTDFGDSDGLVFGSELNAAYAKIENGNLNLLLTGNLQDNFNKLNIFIDSVAGGQNVIGPDTANGGVNPTNDNWAQKYNGLTFDTGFEPDYLVISRNGSSKFDLDFNSVGNDSTVEETFDVFGGTTEGSATGVGASGLSVAFDNSNVAGIAGGTMAANAAAAEAVSTGLELSIPISALGNPAAGSTISVSAQINGSNHDFLSNQFLGGMAATQGNLGTNGAGEFVADSNLGLIDLSQLAGDQFFTILVPGTSLLGDFDGDGDVDIHDLDRYNGNLDQAAVGDLAELDLDNSGTVNADDFRTHYETLVETNNNGVTIKGTALGDLNLDGRVDVLNDAFELVNNLGQPATSWAEGDLDASENVDVLVDAFSLVQNLGANNASVAPASTAVPEPSSVSLIAIAAMGLGVRRKR